MSETLTWDHDIKVMYVTADSFPEGIGAAHGQLHAKVPFSTDRKYFGLLRPENGGTIVYRAAAEELEPGEAEHFHCETLVLKKGTYILTKVHDYMNKLSSLSEIFDELLSHEGIDPEGYCVEWYLSDRDVNCMVRLAGK